MDLLALPVVLVVLEISAPHQVTAPCASAVRSAPPPRPGRLVVEAWNDTSSGSLTASRATSHTSNARCPARVGRFDMASVDGLVIDFVADEPEIPTGIDHRVVPSDARAETRSDRVYCSVGGRGGVR